MPCHHPCVHHAAVPALLSASHPSLLSLLLSRCCQLDPVTPAPSQVPYPRPQQLSAPAALPLSSVCHWAGICARASCWSVRLSPPQGGQEGTLLSCMSQHAAPSLVVCLPAPVGSLTVTVHPQLYVSSAPLWPSAGPVPGGFGWLCCAIRLFASPMLAAGQRAPSYTHSRSVGPDRDKQRMLPQPPSAPALLQLRFVFGARPASR